jgi:hypothetical protein
MLGHHNCLHMDKSQQVRPSHRCGHHIMASNFCQGFSISGYIKIPCTGICVKTSMFTKTTWHNYINHDGKVSRRSNSPRGTSTPRSKVKGSKMAAPSLTLPCAAAVMWPWNITITESSQEKCQTDTHDKTAANVLGRQL